VQSARGWRYKPAIRGGRPASGTVDVVLDFKLTEQ
jgi:hypothetical protein